MILVGLAAFVGVTALVGGVAMLMRDRPNRMESRLSQFTSAAGPKEPLVKNGSVLSQPLDSGPGFLENLVGRIGNFNPELFFEQADTSLTVPRLALICGGLAAGGAVVAVVARLHPGFAPLLAAMLGSVPLVWLFLRRRRRLKLFAAQLPEALDTLSRGLRAGQSLAAAFNMISTEVAAPLGKEFARVFDEQNLGVPLEESLESMTERIPNLDLKFFVTAVILQRQTGGDLAEILDKIAHLIRERFQIWGQVQALTGEGRLSGAVLLGLPVVLFLAVYKLNHDYVMVLFTDPLGKKMLAAAVILQVLGALVIRKIVTIRV
jgi:tight adherence protein B